MSQRRIILILIISLPLLVPFISFLLWWSQESKSLKILIYDMTVPKQKRDEHLSLSWILINQKFESYDRINDPNKDYRGFFPLKDFQFITKDFSKFSVRDILQVADSLEAAYYTDTYGIYRNEWYDKASINERSAKIYGGLNRNDLLLIKRMQDQKKLVLAEFNFFASPTARIIRRQAEQLLDVRWTGWVGRYYDPLDTVINKDIPEWAKKLYLKQYGKTWNFHNPGIILVHESDKIVVLENDSTLSNELPWVYSSKYGEKRYGIPNEISYPYWFDILESGVSNTIVSRYKIYVNEKGKKLLDQFGIPDNFPCVIENRRKNYYYFCGDFADNPIEIGSAKFKGVTLVKEWFYDRYNYIDRTSFFWKFYRPMVSKILSDYERTVRITRTRGNQ